MAAGRALRWTILILLLLSSVFLASFNATLRYIVDERRTSKERRGREDRRKEGERTRWEEAGRTAKDELRERNRRKKREKDKKAGSDSHSLGDSDKNDNENKNDKEKNEGDSRDFEPEEEPKEPGEDSIDRERRRRQAEREMIREQGDPTPGKFRTTIRPLDGLAEGGGDGDDVVEEGEGSGDDGAGAEEDAAGEFRERPPVQSLSARSARHSRRAPHPALKSSTAHLADAHYAKALRMLSSDFDRLANGGNALPHEVHAGEYDQGTGGKDGRGDKFVRMEARRGRRKTRAKKSKRRAGGKERGSGKKGKNPFVTKGDSKWELPEGEPILNAIWDTVNDWFSDAVDYAYETFGIETDYEDDSSGNGSDGIRNEEDIFSWEETRMGSQLIWIYRKVVGLWSRQSSDSGSSLQEEAKKATAAGSSASSEEGASLSEQDQIAREGLFHLEKAAELGHSEAQRVVANSLASGILPLSDHSLMHRVADYQYHRQSDEGNAKNWTSVLLQSTVEVPDDFSMGDERLSRAILLWHLSAMDGNVESAMALGYRHLYSANGGSTLSSDLANAAVAQGKGKNNNGGGGNGGMNMMYNPHTGGPSTTHGTTPISHYGVLGTCGTALAYYEAAAHGVMDALEGGPTRGKVKPPSEEHRLAEIYTHGGASSALDSHNKPDELEEALQYFRMLASRNRSPEPDLVYSFTLANFYYHGFRGVKQDLRLALKYFEICGDFNHWEGGGKAGLMHVWGIGVSPEERDLGKAYAYFSKGTPLGLNGCIDRHKQRKRQHQKKDGATEELALCDKHCVTGMGLLHLLGVEGLVDRNVNIARRWFEHGKDLGDPESQYNYAMLRLGWMVAELEDLPTKIPGDSTALRYHKQMRKTQFDSNYMAYRSDTVPRNAEAEARSNAEAASYTGPSSSDYNIALQELSRAASHGHLQAKHKLGMLYAAGASVPKKKGRPQKVVTQNCASALRYFKAVADEGHTVSRRNRAAWKQYGAGDHVSALRNYLAAAETGNEVGQVNAAFLLEQGHCLGMTKWACTRASMRLWRAAARQGNLEACLRVGDFFYYGRMKMEKPRVGPSPVAGEGGDTDGEKETLYNREEYLASLEAKAFYFIPGPYRWARYILYPEELFDLAKTWIAESVRNLRRYALAKSSDEVTSNNGEAGLEVPSPQEATCDETEGTCSAERNEYSENDLDKETDEHMAIAAQYYRKAAEEHKSPRAHFNLGFMHEWGLGLTQDFPLAKRHYDLAREMDTPNLAPAIALWAMDLHQKVVRFGIMMKDHARSNNYLTAESDAMAPANEEPSPPVEDPMTPLHITVPAKEKQKQNAEDGLIGDEGIINSMSFEPKHPPLGHFSDQFETGTFEGLPWSVTQLWTIENTNENAPFEGRFSAYTSSHRVSDTKQASLRLEINSFNGGRLCFNLFAEITLPHEELRLYRNSEFYRFNKGTMMHPHSWVDWCFDIPSGKQRMEWALASPGFWDARFKDPEIVDLIESSRSTSQLSGNVFLDNIRFFPFVYDNFESGDFSLQKWRQYGDGAPWVVSDFNAHGGKYAAYAGPTFDNPSGTSNLELAVDLGYTSALVTFRVKVKTASDDINDCLWFLIDQQRIRLWRGDDGEYAQYTHHINEGVHLLTWSFVSSGKDHNAGVWLDDLRFYSREGTSKLIAELRDVGWPGRGKGRGPPGIEPGRY